MKQAGLRSSTARSTNLGASAFYVRDPFGKLVNILAH